jgi:hypothetical protein
MLPAAAGRRRVTWSAVDTGQSGRIHHHPHRPRRGRVKRERGGPRATLKYLGQPDSPSAMTLLPSVV